MKTHNNKITKSLGLLLAIVMAFSVFSGCASNPEPTEDPDKPVNPGEIIFRENDFAELEIKHRVAVYEDAALSADDGEIVYHRFDMESAEKKGVSMNKDQIYDHFCEAKSFQYSPEFGGNICMKNGMGITYTFNFKSDKTVRVPVKMRVSTVDSYKNTAVGNALSSYFSVSNNGMTVDMREAYIPEPEKQITSDYFMMTDVEFKMNIAKGDNKLVVKASKTSALNVDSISIGTSAALTDFTPSSVHSIADFVKIDKQPTFGAEGTVTFVCVHEEGENEESPSSFAIPALNETDYVVEVSEDGEWKTYYLVIAGEKIELYKMFIKPVTVILSGGVTYKDGSAVKEWISGDTLTEEDLNIVLPEGMTEFVGFYDAKDRSKKYTLPVTLDDDITLVPYFKAADTVAEGNGKIKFGYSNDYNGPYLCHELKVDKRELKWDYICVNEQGALVTVTGEKGGRFRAQTSYKVEASTTYKITYRVENLSDETLKMHIDQVLGGAGPGTVSENIVLEKGKSGYYSITFTSEASNGHLLHMFYFDEATVDQQFTICAYIEKIS